MLQLFEQPFSAQIPPYIIREIKHAHDFSLTISISFIFYYISLLYTAHTYIHIMRSIHIVKDILCTRPKKEKSPAYIYAVCRHLCMNDIVVHSQKSYGF